MQSFQRNIRGVSPIIATLLLVAIAVAAAVVTYTWTMSLAQNNSQQAQTGVKVDQVLFGKTTAVTTHVTAGYAVGITEIVVDNVTGFAIGDKITVETQIRTISAINTVTKTLTIDALTDAIDNTDLVEKPESEGLLISVRNTGSVAATIDTIYVFKGDDLISTNSLTGEVIAVGATRSIGIIDAGSVLYWSNLKSGGVSLPNAGSTNTGDLFGALTTNTPYTVRIITSTGFILEGTYYSPGNFS